MDYSVSEIIKFVAEVFSLEELDDLAQPLGTRNYAYGGGKAAAIKGIVQDYVRRDRSQELIRIIYELHPNQFEERFGKPSQSQFIAG